MNIAIELAIPLNIIRMGIRNEMGALMKRAVRQATGSVYWEDGTEMNCYLIYKAHLIPGFEIMELASAHHLSYSGTDLCSGPSLAESA